MFIFVSTCYGIAIRACVWCACMYSCVVCMHEHVFVSGYAK